MKSILIILLALVLSTFQCFSQNILNPVFTPFKGVVYKIPTRQKVIGYGEFIYDLEKAGEVSMKKINVPDSYYKTPFPGLEFMHRFGIIFNSEMTIAEKGVYIFSLNSDDGTILWINGNKIIDNDGTHEMTEVSDTVLLDKGNYPIKIWYFQGFPDRYGIEFEAIYHKEHEPEEDKKYVLAPTRSKYIFDNTRLPFKTNSIELSEKGIQTVDSLAKKLAQHNFEKIIINGHTDDVGTNEYNMNLSLKRAESIKKLLAKKLKNRNVKYEVNGLGENEPIASNRTESNRARNRRVEIIVEYK